MSAFLIGCVMPQYSVDIFVWDASSWVPVHLAEGDLSTGNSHADSTSGIALLSESALVILKWHHFYQLSPAKSVSAKLWPGQWCILSKTVAQIPKLLGAQIASVIVYYWHIA